MTVSQVSKESAFPTCEFTNFNSNRQSNICLYVGSFDPPHIGHQTVVNLLLNQTDIDYVMIIPTFNHCFKENLSSFEHRINMICLTFNKTLNVMICPVEKYIVQECGMTENRTIDTIEFLRKKYYNNTFSIAMGSDLFNTLSTWKSIEQYNSISINVILRQNNDIDTENMSILTKLNIPFRFLNNSFPIYNVSSSDIKHKIFINQNTSNLMSCDVFEYIQSNPELIEIFNVSHTKKEEENNCPKKYNLKMKELRYDQSFC
jgi:nicotinate-nucleotide adenylyltransferase